MQLLLWNRIWSLWSCSSCTEATDLLPLTNTPMSSPEGQYSPEHPHFKDKYRVSSGDGSMKTCWHLLTCSSLQTPSPRAFLSLWNGHTNYLHQNKVFPKIALSLSSFLKAAFSRSPGFLHSFIGQCAWPWPAVRIWWVWMCTDALVASPQLAERHPNLPKRPCALPCVCVRTCGCACMCVHVCVRMYVCACMCAHVCVQ